MRKVLAFFAALLLASFVFGLVFVFFQEFMGIRLGAIPIGLIGGSSVWIGLLLQKKINAGEISTHGIEEIAGPSKTSKKIAGDESEFDQHEAIDTLPPTVRDIRDSGKAQKLSRRIKMQRHFILFWLGAGMGLIAGYMIGITMTTASYPVPKTLEECHVAIGNARTKIGAQNLEYLCEDKFPDF